MNTAAANSQDAPVQTSPQFIQSIQAGLRYWLQKTETLGPEQVQWLDQRRKNLHQAVLFGLNQPATWEDTARLLLQAFDFSEWRGYWLEWIPVFEQALANAPEKETVVYGRLQNRLGQLYRLDSRLPEAETQHKAALEIAQSLANDELLVITYNCLAEYHLSQKNVGQTRAYGQATLDLAQTIPSLERMEAFARLSLGNIEAFVGNWSAAIHHYQKANQIWRKLDNHTYLARSLTELGSIYSATNSFVLAQQAYEEAWGILQFTNNEKDKIGINLNLGILYYRQEKWADAEVAFLQVDPIALREQNEFYLLASFYNNLGNVYLKMQEWEKASEQLILACEIFRETNNQLDLGNSLGTLASVYKQDGQHGKALQFYQEAVSLLQKFPESQWAQKLLGDFLPAYEELQAAC
jgi:tetratricopeptide (TPR) repeat protein